MLRPKSLIEDLVGPSSRSYTWLPYSKYSCYQCVSTSDNEGDCSENDLEKLAPFNKPCPTLEEGTYAGSEAKGCRKIIQTVEAKKSVIRECAYTGETVDGVKKTGNWGINMYYYQCENSVSSKLANCQASFHSLSSSTADLLVADKCSRCSKKLVY
ncbi:unnamed protein product [Cylicostephanus goldi]|uniref:Protein quiver n=1 Tax=Cylicostephanus goldi TaxID=71465 RepID=A0A3P7N255_CYLGO|nr:unnamed protein product [Cylicostephanus goldi]